jgi:Lar family restriction alleviation protein
MEIKSCPFCGSESELIIDKDMGDITEFYIQCKECMAKGPYAGMPISANILWNNRPKIIKGN